MFVVKDMKRFKKVYLEITNVCNLRCPFCIGNERKKEFLSLDRLSLFLEKLKPYTDYLYFHLMGEPLMHPQINEVIDMASSNFQINITTNGYLIQRIKDNTHIRQLNISLHSFDDCYDRKLDDYLNDIFSSVEKLYEHGTIINYRLWVHNKNAEEILHKLSQYYGTCITGKESVKIKDRMYLDIAKEFVWPSLSNDISEEHGTCLGLKDHIGILVDGTVVPCCLDSAGVISLGNLQTEDVEDILKKDRTQNILQGFACGKKVESLCKKCNFYEEKV